MKAFMVLIVSAVFMSSVSFADSENYFKKRDRENCLKTHSDIFCAAAANVEEFSRKVGDDQEIVTGKAKESLNIMKTSLKSRKIAELAKVHILLDEMEVISAKYEKTLPEAKAFLDFERYEIIMITYGYINETTGNVRLALAAAYKAFGKKEKAKQIYRDIIIRYTGHRYKSLVKEAEFGLEDLKEDKKKSK